MQNGVIAAGHTLQDISHIYDLHLVHPVVHLFYNIFLMVFKIEVEVHRIIHHLFHPFTMVLQFQIEVHRIIHHLFHPFTMVLQFQIEERKHQGKAEIIQRETETETNHEEKVVGIKI